MKPALLWHFQSQFAHGYLPPAAPYVPVYARCLSAVFARVQSLGLGGIAAESIVLREVPWARDFTQGVLDLPGIVITPEGAESASISAGTNRRDDIGYPILVTLLAADNEQSVDNLRAVLRWREVIARAFRQQRLSDVDEVIACQVENRPVIGAEAYQKGMLQSALLLRFISREPRRSS